MVLYLILMVQAGPRTPYIDCHRHAEFIANRLVLWGPAPDSHGPGRSQDPYIACHRHSELIANSLVLCGPAHGRRCADRFKASYIACHKHAELIANSLVLWDTHTVIETQAGQGDSYMICLCRDTVLEKETSSAKIKNWWP